MHKLNVTIKAEGGKITIYNLRDELDKLLNGHSCHYNMVLTKGDELIESVSGDIIVPESVIGHSIEEEIVEAEVVEDPLLLT